jgi:hypothetical protein
MLKGKPVVVAMNTPKPEFFWRPPDGAPIVGITTYESFIVIATASGVYTVQNGPLATPPDTWIIQKISLTEKMSPVLESVVRALHVGFDSYGAAAKELAILDGRKAMKAMYDCTQGMRVAGHAALDASEFTEPAIGSKVGYAAMGEVWRAMLDEVLRRRS